MISPVCDSFIMQPHATAHIIVKNSAFPNVLSDFSKAVKMSKPLSTNNNRRQSEEAILDADPKEVKIDPCTALVRFVVLLLV